MIAAKNARSINRIGQFLALFGLVMGIAVFVGWQLSRGGQLLLWILPLGVGSLVSLVGMILERSAAQSDVGRQMGS